MYCCVRYVVFRCVYLAWSLVRYEGNGVIVGGSCVWHWELGIGEVREAMYIGE